MATGIVATHLVSVALLYARAQRVLRSRGRDLLVALRPALLLNGMLAAVLAVAHFSLGEIRASAPVAYLLAMVAAGGLVYVPAFLLLPIAGIESEAARWRRVLLAARARLG